jgi:hypothetical protein
MFKSHMATAMLPSSLASVYRAFAVIKLIERIERMTESYPSIVLLTILSEVYV